MLDPRELYKFKKNSVNSSIVAQNKTLEIIKLQTPGPPTLAHKKLSMYQARMSQGQPRRLAGS